MASENETIYARAPRHAHAADAAAGADKSLAQPTAAEVREPDAVTAGGPCHRRPAAEQARVGGHARHAASTVRVPSHARHAAATEEPVEPLVPDAADSPESTIPVSPVSQPASRKETVPVARYRAVVAGFVAAVALFAVVFAFSPFNPMRALQANDAPKKSIEAASAGMDLGQSAYADDQIVVSDEDRQQLGQIVIDGRPIDDAAIAAIALAHAPYKDQVGTMDQNDVGLPSGCEIVSLAVLLQSLGFDADPSQIADEHLVMDGNFGTGYAGSPYGAGGGYPPGIVGAANSYLLATGSSVHAYDLTGTSFEGIKGLVSHGYPVLVWATMFGEDPIFSNAFDGEAEWYVNEHCVVVCGISDEGVMTSDPIEGYVVYDEGDFARIYYLCGNMAAVAM